MASLIGEIVWGSKNPRAISEKQMHPQHVCCGFWGGDIIGLYFFENEAGRAASVNRYRDRITQFFLPKLDDIDVANMWFQDNATANETIQLPYFLVVYSLSDQNWPPRSCDLTSLDSYGVI